jgi:hypothetical protein
MRYITVPENIKIAQQPDPIPFLTLIESWTNDNKFGALGITGTKMSIAIHNRFVNAKAGDEIPLDDKEWTTLCDVVNNPTGGYVTIVARQLMPFCDAVLEASTVSKKTISANGKEAHP